MRTVGSHLGRIANRLEVPDKGGKFGSTSPLIHNPDTTRHDEQHPYVPPEAPETNSNVSMGEGCRLEDIYIYIYPPIYTPLPTLGGSTTRL